MADDRMIAALLRERDGLTRRGLDDRVAQVDEQLKLHGHVTEDPEEARAQARRQQPRGRSATASQQTAD